MHTMLRVRCLIHSSQLAGSGLSPNISHCNPGVQRVFVCMREKGGGDGQTAKCNPGVACSEEETE